ncbi:serine/threonine protein kinase [Catenuloplanes nepalensis]|uniref:non-specific serine/threonine protein kinase n=1 Tax=Catenuloplanes nepalensis TaxID=587533 RepID=A0ABT9N7Q4_9ACTN|nr:serine/threonine protein kinase [Catenuloplanes nepalensis]MDP9799736.1 serine/threonine protein kinase [Catenuloplanes nepalensis]
MSDTPQREIAGRYRLLRPLGQGAMGRVWLARDEMLQRDVALKEIVPPAGLTGDEVQELRERALREARAIAKVSQSNVVRIFDVLRTGEEPWIVMEYVNSSSLQKEIAANGPITPARAAEIGIRVLGALRAAHAVGVLHRDIKPANVLLGADGRIVLTDFGLATATDDPGMTRTGVVMGSPAYLAPERATGGQVGASADLWSLGASLYAAVEGRAPYTRPSSIATLAALATELPPMPQNAGPLLPALEGLLRRDPARRVDAFEAERLLRHALSGAPAHAGAGMPSGTWANPDAAASGGISAAHSAHQQAVPVGTLSQARHRHVAGGPTTMLPAATTRPDGGPTVEIPPAPSVPLPPYGGPPPRSRGENGSLYLLVGALVVVLVLAVVLGIRVFNPSNSGGNITNEPDFTLPTVTTTAPRTPSAAPSPTPSRTRNAPSPTPAAPTSAAPQVITPVAADRSLVNAGSNRCFAVAGSNPAAPEPIHIWDCDGTPGTKFTLPGTGALQVLGNCIQADSPNIGSQLHIAPCTGDLSQTFGLSAGGDLISIPSGKCLDVTGGIFDNGTPVQLYDCNGTPAQKWLLS